MRNGHWSFREHRRVLSIGEGLEFQHFQGGSATEPATAANVSLRVTQSIVKANPRDDVCAERTGFIGNVFELGLKRIEQTVHRIRPDLGNGRGLPVYQEIFHEAVSNSDFVQAAVHFVVSLVRTDAGVPPPGTGLGQGFLIQAHGGFAQIQQGGQ